MKKYLAMPCLFNKYIEDFLKGLFYENKIYLQNTKKMLFWTTIFKWTPHGHLHANVTNHVRYIITIIINQFFFLIKSHVDTIKKDNFMILDHLLIKSKSNDDKGD